MQKKLIALAVFSTLVTQTSYAQTAETPPAADGPSVENLSSPRVRNLEKRIEYLEKQLEEEQKGAPDAEGPLEDEADDGPTLELGGVVEVEAAYIDVDGEDSETGLVLSTAELAIGSQMNQNFRGDIGLLYEEGEDLDVDTAFITYMNDEQTFGAVGGLFYVPFGNYATGLLSDPLTLDLGETQDTAAMVNFATGPVNTAVYLFKGESEADSNIDTWGINFGSEFELGGNATQLQAGYISNIAESGGLLDTVGEVSDAVPGLALAAILEVGPTVWIGEYVTATDNFAPGEFAFEGAGAQPSAWNLEFNYISVLGGKPANFAVAYQGSDEADGLIPETKALAGMTVNMNEWVSFGLEYSAAEDYAGVGENVLTAKVSAAF